MMDTSGMLRPKNPEAATAQLAAYLLNYPPAPNDPRMGQHQVALEALGIIGNKIIPPAPRPENHHSAEAALGKMRGMTSLRKRSTSLGVSAPIAPASNDIH